MGALIEASPGERRVALDPSAAARLIKARRVVLIESGAGTAASFIDDLYTAVGATVASRKDVLAGSDILALVRAPEDALVRELRRGQTLIGLIDPLNNLATMGELAERGVTAVAFELLPRTISRAQSMDAMSSQSNAAGYRAAILAAEAFSRYLPMMITASGTAVPAKVIVIGTGVAGLQTIATMLRLGAVVTGYDVRSASRGEVESLGAQFLTPTVSDGGGSGGYAREMSAAEQESQQEELADSLRSFDVIITTAKVPGHTPPLLVSEKTLTTLRPGSVCIDLGSSDRGGNVAGSVPGAKTVTAGGVTILGAGELASQLPTSASQMYARNVTAVIASLFPADVLLIDPADEIHQNIVVSHEGEVTNARLRQALKLEPLHPRTVPVEVTAA